MRVQVWKWRTGECLVLEGHKEPVRKFHLLNSSSSSPHILSWSFDGTVKVIVKSLKHSANVTRLLQLFSIEAFIKNFMEPMFCFKIFIFDLTYGRIIVTMSVANIFTHI